MDDTDAAIQNVLIGLRDVPIPVGFMTRMRALQAWKHCAEIDSNFQETPGAAALESARQFNNSIADAITAIPTYAGAFACIGGACEDTCCQNWNIPIDRNTYERYQSFENGMLRAAFTHYVKPITPAMSSDAQFALIHPKPSGTCPFLNAHRLCSIHATYGEELLSATCSTYPRTLNEVDGQIEGSLFLSCPEAARTVLLDPFFLRKSGSFSAKQVKYSAVSLQRSGASSIHKPYAYFRSTRELLFEIVRDRTLPLWQRVLFIGSLCSNLDRLTSGRADAEIPKILDDHRIALSDRLLHRSLNDIPAQPGLKLSVFLKLTKARIEDEATRPRFLEIAKLFVEGSGCVPDVTLQEDTTTFVCAEETFHRPFFASAPFILENYLVNYMIQNLFPFGRKDTIRDQPRSIFDEYILMATQFAWLDTLLIGIAGYYKESFGPEHIVKTVQSFSRTVEHNGYILASIVEYIKSLQLDSLQGIALLLRNE